MLIIKYDQLTASIEDYNMVVEMCTYMNVKCKFL